MPLSAEERPGYDLEALTAEQQAFARSTDAFIAGAEKAFAELMRRFDSDTPLTETRMERDAADYRILVGRGQVIEKAGLMTAVVTESMPPYINGPIWNRWVSIDIHPRTPLVGMLHLTLTVQFTEGAPPSVGGWVDTMPAARIDEDLAKLRTTIDDVFARDGRDPAPFRELICKGYEDEIDRSWRRKPSCGGVSFYIRPPLPADEASLALISDAFTSFLDAYLEILDRRKDQAFTSQDLAAQDLMRRQWLQDQLFSDPFSSQLVPYEVWSLANMAPVVKF
jgi:coproporphyrinogen III oxidase